MKNKKKTDIKIFAIILLAAVILAAFCSCDSKAPVFSLDTPKNIRVELGVLKWDKVEKADEYVLTVNGEQIVTSGTSYDGLNAGETYEITLRARNVWTLSEKTEVFKATILSVPENFVYFKEGGRFLFDEVKGATGYIIIVDGVEYKVNVGERADFEFYEAGTKQAKIRALGDGETLFDSPYSDEMPVRVDEISWESVAKKTPLGKGTTSSPYKIATLENFKWFCSEVKENSAATKGKVYLLTADIDMRFITGFEPIGSSEQPFFGKFDGGGHSIFYLHIEANKAGVFGCVGEGAEVMNLNNVGGKIKGYTSAGGISASNLGLIMNCKNSSSVEGSTAGGIVAENTDSKLVLSCENSGSVSGENVGGIAGWNWNGTLNQCKNSGSVSATANGGGIVGTNAGNVFYCENSGSVSAKNAGGVAYVNLGTIKSACNVGDILGEKEVGGVVAKNSGTIKYAYNTGRVDCQSDYSDKYVGGIVGRLLDGKLILCYNVNSEYSLDAKYLGSVVGYYRSGLLSDCYCVSSDDDEIKAVGNTETFIGDCNELADFSSEETVKLFNSLVNKEDLTVVTSSMFVLSEDTEYRICPIFYWQ